MNFNALDALALLAATLFSALARNFGKDFVSNPPVRLISSLAFSTERGKERVSTDNLYFSEMILFCIPFLV
jgi:hypothetical protein